MEGERVSRYNNLTLKFIALLVILKPDYASDPEIFKIRSLNPRLDPQNQNPWHWATGI